MKRLAIFILFIIFVTPIRATDYYVATSGNDSNSGTETKPWKTIQKAAGTVVPGDTVYVRSGVYKEQVTLTKSGTSTNRINFLAYQNEYPIIDGSSMASIKSDGLVQVNDGVDYVTINGFTIKGSPENGVANRGSNNVISNNKILLSRSGAIWHRFGKNTVFSNNEMYFNVLMNATTSSETNVVCNTVASWWDAALNSQNSTGASWENNFVHDNCGEGIVAHGGDKVVGNTFKDNWSVNIYIDNGSNILVDRNFIYETETAYMPIGSNYSYKKIAAAFAIADELSPCATYDNTISNNIAVNIRYGLSFYPYTSCSGVKTTNVVDNTFVNYWDYGIRIPGSTAANSGSSIARNTFYSSRGKAMIIENPADFKIQNNTWYVAGGSLSDQFQWGANSYDFINFSGLSSQTSGNRWEEPKFASVIPSDPKLYTIEMFTEMSGDTNNDAKVDLLDFANWKKEYLGQVTTKIADFNNDNKVDLLDFAIWKKTYVGI